MIKTKKLRIYLDQDGVLADTQTEILKRYNQEYGLNFTLDDIYCWDLNKIQKKGTDMTKYFKAEGFFNSLEPIEGAKEIVKLLAEIIGDEVIIATVSPKEGEKDKRIWLKNHFPFISRENILMVDDKSHLIGDILVDDGLHNLENSMCEFPIVFDQPWNRSTDKYIRVYDWLDLYEVIQQIRLGQSYEEIYAERKKRGIKQWGRKSYCFQ